MNFINYLCKSNKANKENPLLRLCDCPNFNHYNCLKKELDDKMIPRENKKKNTINYNYYIRFHCNACKIQLPIRFIIPGIEKNFELLDIKKQDNEEYLLFESLDYLTSYKYYQR